MKMTLKGLGESNRRLVEELYYMLDGLSMLTQDYAIK